VKKSYRLYLLFMMMQKKRSDCGYRTNLRDKTKPGKYYAIPTNMTKITMYDIGREIGRRSTIKMPVLVAVLKAMAEYS